MSPPHPAECPLPSIPPPPLPGAGHIDGPQHAAAGQGLPAVLLLHAGAGERPCQGRAASAQARRGPPPPQRGHLILPGRPDTAAGRDWTRPNGTEGSGAARKPTSPRPGRMRQAQAPSAEGSGRAVSTPAVCSHPSWAMSAAVPAFIVPASGVWWVKKRCGFGRCCVVEDRVPPIL